MSSKGPATFTFAARTPSVSRLAARGQAPQTGSRSWSAKHTNAEMPVHKKAAHQRHSASPSNTAAPMDRPGFPAGELTSPGPSGRG